MYCPKKILFAFNLFIFIFIPLEISSLNELMMNDEFVVDDNAPIPGI